MLPKINFNDSYDWISSKPVSKMKTFYEAKIPNEFAQLKASVFNETPKEGGRSLLKSLMKVAEKVAPKDPKRFG